MTPLLVRLAPPGTPRLAEIGVDWTVGVFTAGAAILCGLVLAAISGEGGSETALNDAMSDGGRGASPGRRRVRGGLVALQVALAAALSVGAGLLTRSFLRVLEVDPGFTTESVLSVGITTPARVGTDAARVEYYRQLFAALKAVPGVVSAGGVTRLPLGGANSSIEVAVVGRVPPDGQWPLADFRRAVHDYFTAVGISLRRGRPFTDADGPDAPPVAIVNAAFARQMFGDDDPLGRRIRLGQGSPLREATIVGIVGDVRHAGLDVAPAPEVYVHYLQAPPVAPLLVVRTATDPAALAPDVRAALRAFDPALSLYNVRTMSELRSAAVRPRRFVMGLVAAFGGLALVLAAIGVYGALSLVVAERTREMAIRLALGARPAHLAARVAGHALRLAGAGAAGGIVLALMASPLLAHQLYGIRPADPVTLMAVAVGVLLVAAAAAARPAFRVLRADPLATLRCE
jgi:predicted permease